MSFNPVQFDGTEVRPAEADLSKIHADWRERLLDVYTFPPREGWPEGFVRQSSLDAMARVHPATVTLDGLAAATEVRDRCKAELDEANAAWLDELRTAYREGSTARELAEVTGLSSARISQLVGGARKA